VLDRLPLMLQPRVAPTQHLERGGIPPSESEQISHVDLTVPCRRLCVMIERVVVRVAITPRDVRDEAAEARRDSIVQLARGELEELPAEPLLPFGQAEPVRLTSDADDDAVL